jgi:N-acetylmuramoyl-L-alanine amidase
MDQFLSIAAFVLLGAVPSVSLARDGVSVDKPLAGAIIVVDAGHGGQRYSKSYTGGTRGVNSKLTESELNLRVALELEKFLRDRGATVFMTRVADHRLSREGSSNKDELHARIDFFEHHNCHFFLSVHHNAAGASATGHTALYKHNADNDEPYESLAKMVNDRLEGKVPGPKRKLIKGSYHILRETPIPGTIVESGFMTNPEFDELSNQPEYPKVEAEAIGQAAIQYWTTHRQFLNEWRDRLIKERAAKPRDPNTYTAVAINPALQSEMISLVAKIASDGRPDPTKIATYLDNFKSAVVTDPQAKFEITGTFDGSTIRLQGETSDKKYHDQLIDMLVAMRLYNLTNDVKFPKSR